MIDRRMFLAGSAALAALPAKAVSEDDIWTARGSVQRAGGRIAWASLGEGPTVLLLPKVGGWIADWRQVAAKLPGRRLLAIDPPGHGDSTMTGPPPYAQSVPESAAMILAALDELGVGQFSAVGNSLGGCISVLLAALWPQRVERLGLVSVSLTGRLSRQVLDEQEAKSGAFAANGRPLPRTMEQTAKFGTLDPAVNEEQDPSRERAGLWIRPSERGVGLLGVDEYLPRIEAPTLLLFGDRGHYLQYEAVGRARLRNVQVAKVEGAGSFVHQEKPAEVAAALDGFLPRQG